MIKKLGHTKRMQTMRKEWIRENKPRENLDATESTTQEADERERTSRPAQNQSPALETPRTPVQTNAIDDDDDELYAATPRPDKNDTNGTPNKTSTDSLFIFDEGEAVEDQPPEDDLDVWLAEDETKQAERADVSSGTNQLRPRMEDNFDDDMEAMAGLDGKGSSGQRIRSEL